MRKDDLRASAFIISLITFALAALFHGEAQKHFLYLRYDGAIVGAAPELGWILEIMACVFYGLGIAGLVISILMRYQGE